MPAACDVAVREWTDTERLDLLLTLRAQVSPCVDGGYRVWRRDGNRIRWYGRPQPTERAAIDTVLAERDEHAA